MYLNPKSLEIVQGKAEPSLAKAKPGDRYQFERLGYFCADKVTTPRGSSSIALSSCGTPGRSFRSNDREQNSRLPIGRACQLTFDRPFRSIGSGAYVRAPGLARLVCGVCP